jgi:hypothetical protein
MSAWKRLDGAWVGRKERHRERPSKRVSSGLHAGTLCDFDDCFVNDLVRPFGTADTGGAAVWDHIVIRTAWDRFGFDRCPEDRQKFVGHRHVCDPAAFLAEAHPPLDEIYITPPESTRCVSPCACIREHGHAEKLLPGISGREDGLDIRRRDNDDVGLTRLRPSWPKT